jgi:serine/threonine protein kinase
MDVPQIIAGRFRIECEIGKGGMGTVYRATHLGLERPVAVKIIKPEFAADPDVSDRFMREARTMARLRHPNAAMIFDAGSLADGRHFIVMEFVEGVTLSETLAADRKFSPARAVGIALKILDVLAAAHELGIIHRDLKPSNIMIGERGVCVLDFGVAKVLATSADATATHATTGSGVIIGTPRYMSPEQCLGLPVGARSDLYSVGVLVYEMLAGRPPFVDALPSAVLVKQASVAPPPLPRLRQDIPRSLALAVHTLLAKRPEDRPASAAAARSLLERSIVAPPKDLPDVQPFASTVAAMSHRRPVVLRMFTPLILLAVLGAILFVAWGRTTARDESAAAALLRNDFAVTAPTRDSTPHWTPTTSTSADTSSPAPSPMPIDEARRILGTLSKDKLGDIKVVRMGRDVGIVALHDERREGTSHLYAVERKGGAYHVTCRAMLDEPDFRGASWVAESKHVDGDDCEGIMYTGTNPRQPDVGTRVVLYAPCTRRTYSMRLEPDGRKPGGIRVRWSKASQAPESQAYRKALQEKARVLTGASK